MMFIQFILLNCILLVVFGRFIDENSDVNDHKKKLSEKMLPIQILHRIPELKYIPLRKKQLIEKTDDDEEPLLWTIPDKMLESLNEQPILPIIGPDEQVMHLPATANDNDRDDREQTNTESPITESIIQSPEFAATDSLDEIEMEKGRALGTELEESESTTEGTSVELNVTEVYEEPFVLVYVRPLCEGPDC